MSLKCGIVGLPNVGKSTLFNALTKAGIAAENYPFCTIEPNVGIVEVPDPRLAALTAIARPEKTVPAVVEFVDIAGLVAGASKGEGLGNKFLANIRETDAIAHVVRCFIDSNIVHVAGDVNPLSDIDTINTDLDDDDKLAFLADLGLTEPGLDRVIHAGYKLLGLQTFFTAGPKEVHAWTIHAGDTASQAAGVIHTDFERGFIRAEVIAFDDYVRLGGEAKAKEAGKMRLEGKEYVVKDGDVMHFRFNV